MISVAILEDVFDFGINLLRGSIGSYGEVVFEVYNSGDTPHFSYDTEIGGWEGLKISPPVKVLTFDRFQRRTRARYARHQLIGKTAQLEKVGDEPDQITFEIKLIRELGVDPEEQIELIRQYIKDGHEDYLIIGSEVLGQYCITELGEGRQYVDCFGRTQVAELSLTLEEVATDDVRSDIGADALEDLPVIWN